ncbi:Holliday junction branch migration DNA helicase RuvB [Chitinivibrio alkaliphilus]|uniref:Holliday junction branch migration complex subunit RuvB n=1 Tax=Chitinivibrio alkaliphilus ACht1 TaxID=1313304 RepID=U7D7Y7_9BACT|nr:Holliday junction branch migration DNA helicase RuvB [Chitinivibrio alkaliphilus]ERP32053.1 Holliday junction DNA helicase RuvB [Chitinivibrio alkaliphilus ACht1]
MNSNIERIVSPVSEEHDVDLDRTLRPQTFADFIGQEQLKQNLSVFVAAAKKRGEALDHILFSGPPGLGKTTLARILANEIGVGITITSGPVLEKKGDLAGNVTGLEEREIFFIDEIHRLNRVVEESLYPAIEDFCFDIVTGEGPAAKSIRLPLKPFTLVGATTRAGLLTAPMHARFGYVGRMQYYTPEDLQKIVLRSAKLLNIPCDPGAALELGRRSRGTPRIANRLLRRTRDVADVRGNGHITTDLVHKTCKMLGIDTGGLDEMDRAILSAIITHYKGGPVGIKNIAVVVGEESDTIEDVYEPYLIQAGFLKRTPKGREVTSKTYGYLGMSRKESSTGQINLFDLESE